MPGKARVHELAKELGVTSKVILAKLRELGEMVKSPSSTVEPPVVRKLREVLPVAGPPQRKSPGITPPLQMAPPTMSWSPPRPMAGGSVKRESRYYKGQPLGDLTKRILDSPVLFDRHHHTDGYLKTEVAEAQRLAQLWAWNAIAMSNELIVKWMEARPQVSPENALFLHNRKIEIAELKSNDDHGPTLGYRLHQGLWVVEQVAIEIEARRRKAS